jgi:hypothetical protein
VDVVLDGVRVTAGGAGQFGGHAYTVTAAIPPDSEVTVTFRLRGRIDRRGYRLLVVRQPVANTDALTVSVEGAGGARPVGAAGLQTDGGQARADVPAQAEDMRFAVAFRG